jgi:hypothetical protein
VPFVYQDLLALREDVGYRGQRPSAGSHLVFLCVFSPDCSQYLGRQQAPLYSTHCLVQQ